MQAKSFIDRADDPLEQEADRIAEQVVRTPDSPRAPWPVVRGTCTVETEQRQAGMEGDAANEFRTPDWRAEWTSLVSSPGQPLAPETQAYFEPRFGRDFSRVRIHADKLAAILARMAAARALTGGSHIAFAEGAYAPGTASGRKLLAHELTHTIQQSSVADAGGARIQRSPDESQRLLSQFSESTEDQIAKLMKEHPGLTRVNAERAVTGPAGSVPEATGKPLTGKTRIADLKFRQPTVHTPSTGGGSVVLRREVKTWKGGQKAFTARIREAADQIAFDGVVRDAAGNLQAHGGGEILIQAPKGTNAKKAVEKFQKMARSPEGLKKFGRFRSFKLTVVDPAGTVLFDQQLEFPPAEIGPGAKPPAGSRPPPTDPAKPHPTPAGGVPSRGLGGAFRAGLRSGLRSALSAPNIAASAPEFILRIADRAAAAEAMRNIQVKFAKEGFRRGVAAGLMAWSEVEVRQLQNRLSVDKLRNLGDAAGTLKLSDMFAFAQHYENWGAQLGYSHVRGRGPVWIKEVRARGMASLAKQGYVFSEAELFEYDFADILGMAIRDITDPIVVQAVRAGDRRREAEKWSKARQLSRETGAVGMKI